MSLSSSLYRLNLCEADAIVCRALVDVAFDTGLGGRTFGVDLRVLEDEAERRCCNDDRECCAQLAVYMKLCDEMSDEDHKMVVPEVARRRPNGLLLTRSLCLLLWLLLLLLLLLVGMGFATSGASFTKLIQRPIGKEGMVE